MASTFHGFPVLVFTTFLLISKSEQLQSSQGETLMRIQRILNYPSFLSSWNSSTDFCNTEPSSSVTVVCYDESVTQLHIIGDRAGKIQPRNFSIDSFMTTLVSLPNLKVVTLVSLGLWGPLPAKIARFASLEILNMSSNFLYDSIPEEISTLVNLQALILDDNMLTGGIPHWIGSLPLLTVLSLKKNMFNGSLPSSFDNSENLRVLALSHNYLRGDVLDLSHLSNLQVLDLEDNAFGPEFPQLGRKLITLTLGKNKFRSSLPIDMSSYYQLQWLDLSTNKFVGPFLPSILSLPSITHVNIAGNKFTGMLFENQSCSNDLEFVDLSSNLLTGHLPQCLMSGSKKRVLYAGNCLDAEDTNQNPPSFCRNEALAVGIVPQIKKIKQASKATLALVVTGGIIGGIAVLVLLALAFRKINFKKGIRRPQTRMVAANAPASSYPSKLLSDARYITQTTKTGKIGIPAYRTFSYEELEDATGNFSSSAFIGEGSHGQMYKGKLKDGSFIAIRCLKMNRSLRTQNYMHHLEQFSKLRHRNLASAIGHCFHWCLDDSTLDQIFLVFEYVPNGSLRSWISVGYAKQKLNWAQRISAAIGIAKGIQFLHTGVVPGVYSNNLKITDILLDQNLGAKVSSFSLPLLAQTMGKASCGTSSGGSNDSITKSRLNEEQKNDVFDFGMILLEIIVGRALKSSAEADHLKDQLQASVLRDSAARRAILDPTVRRSCSGQSVKTMMEICVRCLHKKLADRPSIEDVLWNLQFAAQVQDGWPGDS